jgi:hypothetical protein
MITDRCATADVNTYECHPHLMGVARAIATVRYTDGTKVRFSVPFTRTAAGETASTKYQQEYRKVLDAMASKRPLPYGERGWKVPCESGEALIGSEISESYSGVREEERLNLEAFKTALTEVCSDPQRIKIAPFYEAEGNEHIREI